MSATPSYYLGLSVGPVVDTILSARKTRELWTASYLFSTLMRELVQAAMDQGLEVWSPVSPGIYTAQSTSLAPASAPPKKPPSNLFGAGIYHDRLYAAYANPEATAQDLQAKFKAIKTKAIEAVTDQLAGDHDFFVDFFRIAHVWLPAKEAATNLLGDLNGLLDTQELVPVLLSPARLKQNDLIDLLEKPYRSGMVRDGLAKDAQNVYHEVSAATTKNGKRLNFDFFPSTAQVAAIDLHHADKPAYLQLQKDILAEPKLKLSAIDSEEDLVAGTQDDPLSDNKALQEFYRRLDNKEVPAFKDHYQDFHKYFCIVHADGDRFGKVIEGLGDDRLAIERFSGQLANFAAAAAGVINAHGGRAIYIGGDDLLFFAPVVYAEKTVFDLLKAIDEVFAKECSFSPQPTLSYGITLSHYKYPLFEAKADSYRALELAKSFKWTRRQAPPNPTEGEADQNQPVAKTEVTGEKNAIVFRFIRHSGSYFTGVMDKPLLDKFIEVRAKRVAEDFLSSFTYKLRELEPLLEAVGDEMSPQRLQNIINNFFDEPIHGENKTALTKLVELHTNVTDLSGEINDADFSLDDNLYAILRVMAFTLPKKTPVHVPA